MITMTRQVNNFLDYAEDILTDEQNDIIGFLLNMNDIEGIKLIVQDEYNAVEKEMDYIVVNNINDDVIEGRSTQCRKLLNLFKEAFNTNN